MHRNPKKEVSSPKPPLAAEEGKGKVIATLMKKKSIHPTKPTGIIIGAWAPTVHVAPTAEWKGNPQLITILYLRDKGIDCGQIIGTKH